MARTLRIGPALLLALLTIGHPVAAQAVATQLSFIGHGYGHGRGMGQYGALGYAIDKGWSYHQILDHYYGATTAGRVPTSTIMTVDMTNRDGVDTIVAQERGELAIPGVTACTAGTACTVRIQRTGSGNFAVYRGTTCGGGPSGWTVVASSVSATTLAVTATAGATDNRADMLALCETGGIRWLRGDIWAVDTGRTQATVNHVLIDSYVRGVIPRESPASWGTLGGGAGEQALLAQAVAARSYAMAGHWAPYANMCDTTSCQVYGGRAFQDQRGNFADLEGTSTYATSDAAAAQTAGEVRITAASGAVALTEFSSSTGGYTAGGAFPAVPDDGDATASNPNHTWTDTAAVSEIQAAYGSGRGTFQSIEVTRRDGNGDLGGRVKTLTIHFSLGDASTTGSAFAGAVGLRSDWFALQGAPSPPPPTTTTPPPAPVGYHVLTSDGTVYAFNRAPWFGSFGAPAAHTTAVSIGERNNGYWVLAGDGGVHPFGAAANNGSLAGKALNAAPFQLAPTPAGGGYWIVAFDGGVFSYGDAVFYGSTGNRRLNKPVVGMAATPSGHGYWLVASDGGIFSFGDAPFYGSTGSIRLNKPIVAMAVSPGGHGYWLIASDGGVFGFGDARYAGSLPGSRINEQAVALAAWPSGGYLVATTAGHVYGFGTSAGGGPADAGARAPTVGLGIARVVNRLSRLFSHRRTANDPTYGGSYFGEGRNPSDRAFLSGYERYDRNTSNANVAAYLAWRTFPAATSLDVGCATGFVVEALRELGVDGRGVDVSAYAVKHAAQGARGHIAVGDLRRGLAFPADSFDLVTALETLEHLPPTSIRSALRELARVSSKWVMCTIPSFGPNRNGPGGWYQVKVRDDRVAYYESLGPGFEGPIPYDDLYRDAAGEPIEGHLTVASFGWWTDRFAEAGLVRCDGVERALHPELARMGLTKYWNLYVLRHADVAEPSPDCRTPAEIAAVLERFGLADRTASAEDLAALAASGIPLPPE